MQSEGPGKEPGINGVQWCTVKPEDFSRSRVLELQVKVWQWGAIECFKAAE